MTAALEWNSRASYALTELILFVLATLVVFIAVFLSFLVSFAELKKNMMFFSTLRLLFDNVLPTAIAFMPVKKCTGEGRVNVVFLGHQERTRHELMMVDHRRVWVHVYFILLCCLVMVWAISVFSDTILYRKNQ